jgi:hypothetical protein
MLQKGGASYLETSNCRMGMGRWMVVSKTGMESGKAGSTSKVIQHCPYVHRDVNSQASLKPACYSSHLFLEISYNLWIRLKGLEERD